RRHQHQVVKAHGFHGAGGSAYVASVAGVDENEAGFHVGNEEKRGA
ncbi:MAG: hypothetical protein RL018_1850, partial [Pseudomonadota bacterium]